jgi:3-oxoacyl-ACP reductase-like protein
MTPSSSAPPASSAAPSASPSSPSPEPAASSSPAEEGAAAAQSAGKMSPDNPISHIEAIEAIIGSGSKLTLEQAQVEQIRTHLAQLRKAVEKK